MNCGSMSWGHNAVQCLTDSATLRICTVLKNGNIAVDTGKGRNRRQALWKCLTSPTCPSALPYTAPYADDTRNNPFIINEPNAAERTHQGSVSCSTVPQGTPATVAKGKTEETLGIFNGSNSHARSSLIKAHSTNPMFGGEWTDNITESIELYETLFTMCGVETCQLC